MPSTVLGIAETATYWQKFIERHV